MWEQWLSTGGPGRGRKGVWLSRSVSKGVPQLNLTIGPDVLTLMGAEKTKTVSVYRGRLGQEEGLLKIVSDPQGVIRLQRVKNAKHVVIAMRCRHIFPGPPCRMAPVPKYQVEKNGELVIVLPSALLHGAPATPPVDGTERQAKATARP
jgi:hypothetical protein